MFVRDPVVAQGQGRIIVLTASLVVAASVITWWLYMRLKRQHEVLVTVLHASFEGEVKALRTELSALRAAVGERSSES